MSTLQAAYFPHYATPQKIYKMNRNRTIDVPEAVIDQLVKVAALDGGVVTPANETLARSVAARGYGALFREDVFASLLEEGRARAAADQTAWEEEQDQRDAAYREQAQKHGLHVPPTGRAIRQVLANWRAEGPLVHEPTGFARLDELTGGGPVYGSRWYLNGQPNAFKTGWLLQVAHKFAERGIVVGLLAVDEEDTDLLMRLAQRVGHSRRNCEIRDPAVLNQIEAELARLLIRFYDATWTIEDAATDLAAFAKSRGKKRMMLGIDSLQTASCAAERAATKELSEMAAVTARVQAIRKVASQYRLIAMATSEMSRSAYRKADPDDLTSTMAASKHSGAVEYSARVLLGLRSVKGESDLIEIDVAKNKHGPSGESVYLQVDRGAQSLWEVKHEPPPEQSAMDKRRSKVADDAEKIVALLTRAPGIGLRQLRSKAGAEHALGKDAVDRALSHLGDRISYSDGPRNAKLMTVADRGAQ